MISMSLPVKSPLVSSVLLLDRACTASETIRPNKTKALAAYLVMVMSMRLPRARTQKGRACAAPTGVNFYGMKFLLRQEKF